MVQDIISLDSLPNEDEIRFLASDVKFTNDRKRSILEDRLSGDRSADFYRGMIAGIKASCELRAQIKDPIDAALFTTVLNGLLSELIIASSQFVDL